MFTVFWVTWLLLKRRERKMQAQLAEAERNVEMGRQTVMAIANAVDAKDPRTSEHSRRVALYSRQIAEACGLDPETCRNIEWTARMHDIGKIGVRDAVLNKAGRLTDEEYGEMKAHTTRGAKILENFTLVSNVIEGAEYHHERYDGKGYPKGLKGEEIPLSARIIGVADAFDAMTANRVYRKQLDFSYVLGELERGKGTQFDPRFVEILLQLIREGQINLNEIYHVSPEDALKAMNQSPGSAAMSSAEAEARARAAAEEDAKAGKTAAAFVPPSGDALAQAGPADRKKPESPEKTEKSEKPDQGGAGS
jgi:energy-coupling factor transport system substrate-specific component